MNKYVKYILLVVCGVILLAVVIPGYIILTFNPNDFKQQIIKVVKDRQQRDLKLDGDIKLTVFPRISLSIGKVFLSEYQSDKEFVVIESAHVSLALLPLLMKEIVVDDVELIGGRVQLVKYKNGKFNIDDLLPKSEQPQAQANASSSLPLEFDIAGVKLDQSELSYYDEAKGSKYRVKQLKLESGRIANGVPVKIAMSANIQANKPKLDVATQLNTTLTVDLGMSRYQADGLILQVTGGVLDISGLTLNIAGGASADFKTKEFTASKLKLNASGNKGNDQFEANLDLPELTLTKNKYAASRLSLDAKYDNALTNIVANLEVPGMEGNAQAFKLTTLTLDVEAKQSEQAFKMHLSTPIAGSIETKQFNFANFIIALNAIGNKLPNQSVSSELKGNVQVDIDRQSIQASLAGGVLDSKAKIKAALKNFTFPNIRYDVELDQLNVDQYLPQKTADSNTGKKAEPEKPFDLTALQSLTIEGSLRIGLLTAFNVKATQLRVDVKARDGVLTVNPLSAYLYQGSTMGSITVNASQSIPSFLINENLSGINTEALVKDVVGLDILQGRANVASKLTTQGNTVGGLKKALNGNMSINLHEGAIKGIDIAKLANQVQSLNQSSTMQTLKPNDNDKTAFSDFKASFKIKNGVAHNDDLLVNSPVLKLTGKGDIDIGNNAMDYTAKAAVLKSEGGVSGTLPVRLSGPFSALKYDVDYAAMLADVAKQKLDEIKAKEKNSLIRRLKGLFNK